MTDKSQTAFADKELGQLLGRAFPTSPALSKQFEDQVMLKADAIDMARSRHRKVARTMAVYWGPSCPDCLPAALSSHSLQAWRS